MITEKKKKKLLNTVMVISACILICCGVFFALSFRGLNDNQNSDGVNVANRIGNINITRDGIGYSLDSDMSLKDNDTIETLADSHVSVVAGDISTSTYDEATEATLKNTTINDDDKTFCQNINNGEVFSHGKGVAGSGLKTEMAVFNFSDATLFISVRSGSTTVGVLRGSVSAPELNVQANSGKALNVYKDESGQPSAEIVDLQVSSLSNFALEQAKSYCDLENLCFSKDDLSTTTEARTKETQIQKIITSGSIGSGKNTCTIEIRCDTILNNMEKLTKGKDIYVPANGTILSTITVNFDDGATVFDILKDICKASNIQLEYSWTPMYNSYYIEGINNLYEFDCGEESGWMYKVNGWFPNYGCSSYAVKDGDVIVWCYTCEGLGADVGGGVY